MRTEKIENLVKDYEFETKEEYFNYIVESLVNGQRQQVKDLFNQMKKQDKKDFLLNYLDEKDYYQGETKGICLSELCN